MDDEAVTPIKFRVEPVDGADPAHVSVGERYWELAGYDRLGRALWRETASAIGKQSYVAAAVGVRAIVDDAHCDICGGALSLTSRAALEQLRKGQTVLCVDCDESLLENMARLTETKSQKAARQAAKARERLEREQEQQREKQRKRERAGAVARTQREIIVAHYAVQTEPDKAAPWLDIGPLAMFAFAVLTHAPTYGTFAPLETWDDLVHPDPEKNVERLGELCRADYLRIHPSTPPSAFEWENNDAGEAVELTTQFWPLRTAWYTPYGPDVATAHKDAIATLRDILTDGTNAHVLYEASVELIAAEARRYFTFQLDYVNLPAVPQPHRERLQMMIDKAAESLSLGQLYRLTWVASRRGATAARHNPRAPLAKMTTHAVNQLEQLIAEALTKDQSTLEHYRRDSRLALAPATRALFETLLHADPMTTVLEPDVEAPKSRQWPVTQPVIEGAFDGPLLCAVCDEPLDVGHAWLTVDKYAAIKRSVWEEEQEALIPTEPNAMQLVLELATEGPKPPVWKLVHNDCDDGEVAPFYFKLPQTRAQMLLAAAVVIDEKKAWIAATDFLSLLKEASTGTGRFAPTVTE
ncbi:hypothetical protein [Salininema proteolyticum]|uniref:Uncharacterized protein n=1 Tax=Salininema proteolyticum TaxID=1607685 RepID=A0ABV8U5B8_9ACTN